MDKINFQNGITPLNDTNLNQMQTNIENAINQVQNNINSLEQKHVYSTEEQVIGIWINGKPIYRKVIGGVTNSETHIAITLPNNFENIVTLRGFIVDNTGFTNAIPTYWNDTLKIVAQINSSRIYLTYGDSFKNVDYVLIVEYTKTTDN